MGIGKSREEKRVEDKLKLLKKGKKKDDGGGGGGGGKNMPLSRDDRSHDKERQEINKLTKKTPFEEREEKIRQIREFGKGNVLMRGSLIKKK